MTLSPTLAHFVARPLAVLVVGIVIAGLALVIRRVRGRPGPDTVVYPDIYLAVGLTCLILSGGIVWLGLAGGMAPGRYGFGPWLGLALAFFAAGLLVAVWAANWRLEIERDGLIHRDVFLRTRKVGWREIERLRLNRPNQALVFDLKAGGKISAPLASGRGRLLASKAEQAGVPLADFRPDDVPAKVETPIV